jgi:sugar lactone lactonase YvrE
MRSGFVFLALFLSIGVVSAQQTPINGPLEGFTFDLPTLSLRPVVGSIGSAALGDPLFRGISFGSVAPQQNYALIFENGRCSVASGLGSAQTSTVRVPGSFVLPEGVAWSNDGSTAVLYSRAGNWVQILSGLPSGVNVGAPLSIGSLGTLSAVATDSHGAQIAIGVAGGVYRVVNGGSFVQLLPLANPITLGFSDDALTLYAVDAGTNQLFALTVASLAWQSWPLSLTDPIAIKATNDATIAR